MVIPSWSTTTAPAGSSCRSYAFTPPDKNGEPGVGPAYSCIAVSTASDPLNWCMTAFEYSATDFYDYPKLGVWGDSYLLSAVHYGAGGVRTSCWPPSERAPLLDCAGRAPGAAVKHIVQGPEAPSWLTLDADGQEAPVGPPAFIGFGDDRSVVPGPTRCRSFGSRRTTGPTPSRSFRF